MISATTVIKESAQATVSRRNKAEKLNQIIHQSVKETCLETTTIDITTIGQHVDMIALMTTAVATVG